MNNSKSGQKHSRRLVIAAQTFDDILYKKTLLRRTKTIDKSHILCQFELTSQTPNRSMFRRYSTSKKVNNCRYFNVDYLDNYLTLSKLGAISEQARHIEVVEGIGS